MAVMSTQFVVILWDHTIVLAKLVSMEMEENVLVTKNVFIILLCQLKKIDVTSLCGLITSCRVFRVFPLEQGLYFPYFIII